MELMAGSVKILYRAFGRFDYPIDCEGRNLEFIAVQV